MPISNDIAALLRAPVGNNLENHPDDLRAAKALLASEGRYKHPVDENKYIDRELDEGITGFQRDHKLKVDGVMHPGGETETMLVSKRLGLPDVVRKEDSKTGYQQTNAMAIPLFGALALGMGLTGNGAAQWWANQSADDREGIVKSLQRRMSEQTNNPDPDPQQDCMDEYDRDINQCQRVGMTQGPRARRACEETAALIMSQCRKGTPPEDRRRLQKEF